LSFYLGDSLKSDQLYFADALEIKDCGIQYHRSGIGLANKGGNDLYERLFSPYPNTFSNCRPVWYGKLINSYSIQQETDEFFNLDYKNILKHNESASFNIAAFGVTPKIIWRQTASRLQATIDHEGRWFRNTIQCAYIKPEYGDRIDPYYLLGVVNSKLITFHYNKLVKESGRVFPQVKITHVKKLPLAIPKVADQQSVSSFVKTILDQKKQNPDADVSALEAAINAEVYKLYHLTDAEIAIIEQAVSG
jgi:hypothetical protein